MSDPERFDVLERRLQALAARIDRDGREVGELREEVARLREEATPSPEPPAPPVQDDQPAIGYREAPAAAPAPAPAPAPASGKARWIIAVAVAAVAAAALTVTLGRRRSEVATSGSAAPPPVASQPSPPYVCERGSETITGRSIMVASGPAVTVKHGCELHLVRCRIEGEVGIDFESGVAKVWLEDTTVIGRRAAVAMTQGGVHEVHGLRSRVRGAFDVESAIFKGEGLTAFGPEEIPGFPTVAPLALLALAREAALLPKDTRLIGLKARFVGTGSLVDFASKLYQSEVEYTFEVDLGAPPPPPEPELPPGVPRQPPPAVARREIHTARLTADGMLAGSSKREITPPRRAAPIEPRCSLAEVWKKALAAGIPEASVARIGYVVWETGQRWWELEIGGTSTRYSIDDAGCADRR